MLNNLISEVMAAPLGNLIYSIGKGVGEAQAALDAGSLKQTLALYASTKATANSKVLKGYDNSDELSKLMKEIGYKPTFYVLPETEVTAMVSIAIAGNNVDLSTFSVSKKPLQTYVTPINAGNANKYNINVQATTALKFKIVPVPPSASVDDVVENDRIDDLLGITYDVWFKAKDTADNVIKLVQEITGLSYEAAKLLVNNSVRTLQKLKEKVKKSEAEALKTALEEAGAEVELR